jgi:hypothetical protein
MSDKTDYRQSSPSMLGTWEYLLDDQEGLSIFTETHIFWILVDKERKPFQGDQPTEAEKVQAYTESFADACTYTFTGPSRVAVHRLYSTHPHYTDFTFEYEIEGDLCRYWVLDPDGSRGPTQMSQRLRE